MIILLAPEKLITSTPKEEWEVFEGKNLVLFTSNAEHYKKQITPWIGSVFAAIEFFDNYPVNDLIEMTVLNYASKYSLSNIIPMTEADVLRVALLKERLNLSGLSYNQAELFRNKIVMKTLARNAGISVPRFRCIRNTLDLIEFIRDVGYPVIVKPILGRGSLNTVKIANDDELVSLLNAGYISNTSRYPDLLAEEYLPAEIYHIDGLQLDNQIHTVSVSRYVNNCLSFVNGSYLGSYTLSMDSDLRKRLVDFTNDILRRVYHLDKSALFHIEVFVDQLNNISLCEVACRIGGNGINDEVKLQQGVDIKMAFIKAECGMELDRTINTRQCYPVSGRLLIPPKEAKLISIPRVCAESGVIEYNSRGAHGLNYRKMVMSNDEIANFLISSNTEIEMCVKIENLYNWFNNNVVWES